MRLNRGTILLLLGSVAIIAAVLILSGQRANAPDVTPEATEVGAGPIFPDIADVNNQNDINRFEVIDNTAGTKVVMTKDESGVWTIAESASPSEMATDQTEAVGTMSVLASLVATSNFPAENIADFGLDVPKYTMSLTETDGTIHTVKVGNPSASPRYYGLVGDDTSTVYLLPKDLIDNLIRQITDPPYVPSPTPTATATATANPYSEVQQTATAAAAFTATAVFTPEATEEATNEATTDVSEATAEMTPAS